MKKYIFSSANMFLYIIALHSQPSLQWVKTYSGTGTFHNDGTSDMVLDNSGNIIITGASYDTSGTGQSDITTIKYDSNGNIVWSKTLDISSNDTPFKIGIDHNNDIIIVGSTVSSSSNGFVAKYSNTGTFLWSKILASTFYSVKFDLNNNIYASGQSAGIFFSKLSSSGTVLWTINESFYNPNIHYSSVGEFDIDNNGYIYIAGIRVTGDTINSSNPTNNDFILSKYDTNGNLIWVKIDTLGGEDEFGFLPANAVICNGNSIYLTAPLTINLPCCPIASPSEKICLSKYDSNGNQINRKEFMYSGSVFNYALKTVFNGNHFYIGGMTSNNPSTLSDYLIIKADTNCNFTWNNIFHGNRSFDGFSDIAADNSGNVFVTGYYENSNNEVMANTIAWDGQGNQLWVTQFNQGYNSLASRIAVLSNQIYVSGTKTLTNTSPGDFLTIKYNTTSGINESLKKESIIIYPNPSSGITTISTSTNSKLKSLSIFDVSGKQILTTSLNNQITNIDISNYENGYYFIVTILEDGTTLSNKLIKTK